MNKNTHRLIEAAISALPMDIELATVYMKCRRAAINDRAAYMALTTIDEAVCSGNITREELIASIMKLAALVGVKNPW